MVTLAQHCHHSQVGWAISQYGSQKATARDERHEICAGPNHDLITVNMAGGEARQSWTSIRRKSCRSFSAGEGRSGRQVGLDCLAGSAGSTSSPPITTNSSTSPQRLGASTDLTPNESNPSAPKTTSQRAADFCVLLIPITENNCVLWNDRLIKRKRDG